MDVRCEVGNRRVDSGVKLGGWLVWQDVFFGGKDGMDVLPYSSAEGEMATQTHARGPDSPCASGQAEKVVDGLV